MNTQANNFFTYKGYPLVRKDNEIYYGNMYDKSVVMMTVENEKKENDISISTKIKVYHMLTDDKLSPIDAIKKQAEKDSLYDALDIAYTWLKKEN